MSLHFRPRRQKLIFSQKLMLAFIRDYKNNVCLWDARLPEYKQSDNRKLAIAKIAKKYDMTEEETKKKINSLRSTYLQEKKKVEESRRDGKREATYEPSLYWYSDLDFLSDVIIPRRALLMSSPGLKQEDETEVVELVQEMPWKTCTSGIKGNSTSVQSSPSDGSDDFQYGDERRNQVTSTSLYNEDEIDAFCRSIALQLRTLPAQDAIELQMNIQRYVGLKRLEVLKRQQQEEF